MRYLGVVVITLVALAGVAAAYAVTSGLDARATPGWLETTIMGAVRRWSIPAGARNRINPTPADEASLHDAMAHFADHCASCHGADGSGNTAIGRGLYPKPPDMRLPQTQRLSDGELFYIIEHGVRFTGMPGFGTDAAGGERESWGLVRLVRQLPALTAAQVEEINGMIPRPPADIRREIEEDRFLSGDSLRGIQ